MEDYKIESQEELIAKIEEEIEVLESIYDGEGVVVKKPHLIEVEADASTNESNGLAQEDDEVISQFLVQCELDVKPSVGIDLAKIGLLVQVRITFGQYYPLRAPLMCFTNTKGLDEEQFDEMMEKFNGE